MPLPPEDLARRRPVWDAMSDLFLDTETRWSVPSVARVCARSGYDDATLDRVFYVEVFPLAIGNMLQVAGEWGMLQIPEDDLAKRAASSTYPCVTRILFGWMVASEWRAVRTLTTRLRHETEARQDVLVEAWNLLARRYFEDPGADAWIRPDRVDAVRNTLREECPRTREIWRSMLVGDEKRHVKEREAEVAAIIGLGE